MWLFIRDQSIIVWIIVVLVAVVASVRVVLDTRSPSKTAAYLLLILLFPIVGSILYFLVGVNYRKRRIYNKKLIRNEKLFAELKHFIYQDARNLRNEFPSLVGKNHDLIALQLGESLSPLTLNKAKLLINGEQKFPCLFHALETATSFIHMEYYIFDEDEIGTQVKNILIRKAKEGVKVRIIFDDFGSHDLWDNFVDELRDSGVEIFPFYRIHFIVFANRLNFRDHRKVVIIDGKVGFIGGMNIADRYINNGNSAGYWRDTHIMLEGDAMLSLQYHFISNWNFCSGQKLGLSAELFPGNTPNVENPDLVQIITSGPDSPRPSIMLSYFAAISMARERVYITTPYFIPNETIVNAIKKAAFSGKDVRLLVPAKSDAALVDAASHFYFQDLLEAGVKIYQYKKGVIHAKTLVVDDTLSIIGTANMDLRSFELNFEINAVVYSERINCELADQFCLDLENAELIVKDEWKKRSVFRVFYAALARILAPLL